MKKVRLPRITVSWWIAALEWLLVRYVNVDETWIERVRLAAAKGGVVFVLRNCSLIDFLCLRGLCKRHGLPRISFVAGLAPFLYLPLWRWLIRLFTPARVEEQRRRFTIALKRGGSALVFLRRPAAIGIGASDSRPADMDGIRIAVEAQSFMQSPVIALPTVFLWGESAMKRLPGAMDFFLGSNEYPRLLRSIWLLVRRRSIHQLISGEPIVLIEIKQERGVTDQALAGVVRAGIGKQIETIRRARLGSLTKPSSRVKEEVLQSQRLKTELLQIAKEQGIPERDIYTKARVILKKLAADFHPRVLTLFAVIMSFVWKRIYTGLDVSKEDMEKMRAFVSKGPTLILPTHKSHIDYMVVSQTMQSNNMMLPHIAAGQNLSFWPLGWIFRSSGAFFIRRKFVNDRLYSAIVNSYIRRLVQTGYSIEIFIEGGRSRTGKLLRPMLGMLEMAIRAVAVTPRLNLGIVPVFIGYERVIEETSYVKESMGRSKKQESIKGLIKSTKVLMSRYGCLYVRIGDPFSLEDVLKSMGLTRDSLDKMATRRDVVLEIALRNFEAINKITVVTPSAVLATVLLTTRSETIAHTSLRELSLWLRDFLQSTGAALNDFISKWQGEIAPEESRNDRLDRTIRAMVKGGRISSLGKAGRQSYAIRDDQRLPLDYYKNNTIHFLVPASLVCTSCLIGNEEHIKIEGIVDDAVLAMRLYRWEFMLRVQDDENSAFRNNESRALVEGALKVLFAQGILAGEGDAVHVVDREKALFLSDVLRNFFEAYFVVISTIRTKSQDVVEGDTAKLALSLAQENLKAGKFIKPEANSRINIQNAIQVFKELKILRPTSGEAPFDEGKLGSRIYNYLSAVIGLK